jgi:hypothetical protein
MRSAFLLVASLAVATSARAAESAAPVRVVLLDAVVLTPALERSNARLNVEQGVMASLREHGWEPVSVNSACKDLSCAAAVAAEAKALYVLILSGRFAQGETYAANVGVSLWRDGTVVATRTEADEDAEVEKAGRGDAFVRCGPPGGACTAQILETKLRAYAATLADDEASAIATRKAAELEAAGKAAAAAQAKPAVPSSGPLEFPLQPEEMRRGVRVLGWSLVIGGGVVVGGAVALWSQNNSGNECHVDGCRREWKTGTAALITGIGGVLAAAGGVTVLLTTSSGSSVALSVHQSGVALGGKF